jgi:hypothetical protein
VGLPLDVARFPVQAKGKHSAGAVQSGGEVKSEALHVTLNPERNESASEKDMRPVAQCLAAPG